MPGAVSGMKTTLLLLLLLAGHFAAAEDELTVHEWGTLTMVVGSDGVGVPWWTLSHVGPAELPEFVKPNLLGTKLGGAFLTRMETPVLYFYANAPMNVRVAVDYPNGTLTEWFPRPVSVQREGEAAQVNMGKHARWDVELLRPDDAAGKTIPALGERGKHYGHAREVPEAWLVKNAAASEVEKFIFYRGAGMTTLPAHLYYDVAKALQIQQHPELAAESVIVVRVTKDGMSWAETTGLGIASQQSPPTMNPMQMPGASKPMEQARPALESRLITLLTEAGLYEAEAKAMVATWREAWMGEAGLRALYVLPRSAVDSMLPITITPKPKRLERVFVARVELIAPEIEEQLLEVVTGSKPDVEKAAQLTKMKLGRFLNAAIQRAVKVQEWKMRNEFSRVMGQMSASAQK